MKKTLTINLNGIVFHIDEDAYQSLKAYLSEIEIHFTSEDDKEILKDIEARIAELFSEKLEKSKRVVDIKDVDEIINVLGHPNQFDEENEEESPKVTKDDSSSKKEQQKYRRYYRDPENSMLGGVAGGLAAYLNWDVTLIRVLFVILIIVGFGWVIPIYLVIWIITPEARTTAQKLEMHGKAVTVETIKEQFDEAKEYVDSDQFKQSASRIGRRLGEVARWLFKIVGIFIGVIFSIVGIIIIGSLIFALIIALIAGQAVLTSMFPFTFLSFPGSYLAIIALTLLIVCPLLGIIVGTVRLLQHKQHRPRRRWFGWTLFITWILSLFILIAFTIKGFNGRSFDIQDIVERAMVYNDNFANETTITEARSCEEFQDINISNSLKVILSQGDSVRVMVTANASQISHIKTDVINGILEIQQDNGVSFGSGNKRATIAITVPNLNSIRVNEASVIESADTLRFNNLSVTLSEASKAVLAVNIANKLMIESSEASKFIGSGSAQDLSVTTKEASKAELEQLTAKNASLKAYEASKIDIGETKVLTIHAENASHVTYKGEPKFIEKTALNMSKISN